MSERHVEQQLAAWTDGALSGREQERVARHLETCPACTAALHELEERDRLLKGALQRDPGEAYLESLSARVAAGIAGQPRRPASKAWLGAPAMLRWASVATVVVAGAAVAILTFRRDETNLRDDLLQKVRGRETQAQRPAVESKEAAPPTAPEPSPSREGLAAGAPEPAPSTGVSSPAAPQPGAKSLTGARAGRAVEMTVPKSPNEEPVPKSSQPSWLSRPRSFAAPPPGTEEGPTRVRKSAIVQPLTERSDQSAPKPEMEKAPAAGSEQPPSESSAGTSAQGTVPAPQPAAGTYRYTQELAPQAAEVQVCGKIVDPKGKALSGVQVVAANLGRVARTNSLGEFCLSLPPGRHELRMLAVGYGVVTRSLEVSAAGERGLAFELVPVSALGEGLIPGLSLGTQEPTAGWSKKIIKGLVDSRARTAPPDEGATPAVLLEAQDAHRVAMQKGSAPAWEAAAAQWERALRAIQGTASELTARAGIAECRYRAWKADPTPARSRAATEALTFYLVRAPIGPARDRAAAWAEELK